jgi:gliding motility-associated-like protein
MKAIPQFCVIVCLFWSSFIHAQNVEITPPAYPNVCESHTIKVKITNDKTNSVSNVSTQILLPCGFEYIKTTANNAIESDITDLSKPIFTIAFIPAAKWIEMSIKVNISCEAYDCIDAQKVFFIGTNVVFDGQNINTTSQPFNVNTAQLVVTFIEPGISNIEPNKILKRSITIKNSRRGRLSRFTIKDTYDGDLSINILNAQLINQTTKSVEYNIDSIIFKSIGNGDQYFDFNEILVLTEDVKLLSCNDRKLPLLSTINTAWGCSEVCQTTTTYATVTPTFILDIGERIFAKATASDPKCYFNSTTIQKLEILENTHLNPIIDLKVRIDDSISNRGIVVGTLTAPMGVTIDYLGRFTNECGQMLATSAILRFPDLNLYIGTVTKSMSITWQTGFCEKPTCFTAKTSWTYSVSYEKDCAKDDDKFFQRKGSGSPTIPLFTSIESKLVKYLNGDQDTIKVVLRSNLLSLSAGVARFVVEIPKEFTIQTNNLLFDGKLPLFVNVTENLNSKFLALEYAMPFSSTSIILRIPILYSCTNGNGGEPCKTEYFTSCSLCTQDSGGDKGVFRVSVRLDFNNDCPEEYQPYTCAASEDFDIIKCDIIKTCYDTIPGHLNFSVAMFRKNIGLADKDNNLWPDSLVSLTNGDILNGALIPSDTFSLVYKGKIVVDKPGATFRNLKNKLIFGDLKSSSLSNLIFMTNMIVSNNRANRLITSILKIKDHSTGKTYQVSGLKDTLIENYLFTDLSIPKLRLLNPSIPVDFEYADADSLLWEIVRFIDPKEYIKSKDTLKLNQFLTGLMLPKFSLSDKKYNDGREVYNCLCPMLGFHIAGFDVRYTNNIFFLHHDSIMCAGREVISEFQDNFKLGYTYDLENEIKDVTKLTGFEMEESPIFEYHTMLIKYGNTNLDVKSTKLANGNVFFDLDTVLPVGYSVSDKFEMKFVKTHKDICINKVPSKSLKFYFYLKTKGAADFILPDTLNGFIGDKYVIPAIKLIPLQPKITAFDNKISTTVDFRQSVSYDFKVKNVYTRLRYSPLITELRLFNTQNGDYLIPVNGIYQLGEIKKNGSKTLGINGKARSCGTEIVYFDYGFGCDTVSDLAIEPCYLYTDSIVIDFQEAAIDLDTDDSPQEVSLCEESTQIIEIFNTQLGTAYELNLDFILPVGMEIVPGSAKLRFPSINGTTLNIPDPRSLGGRKFEWDFKDIWNLHKTLGLSGTTFEPKNAFLVEFRTITNCDFLSGTSIIYNIDAIQLCGALTNNVAKVTNSLNIENTSSPYNIEIKSTYNLSSNCDQDTLQIIARMANPKKGDFRIHVGLDSSYTMVKSLINGIEKLPSTNNGDWRWEITNDNSDSLNICLVVIKPQLAFCQSLIIPIYSSVPTQAICKGIACSIGIITGQSKITIPSIDRSLDIVLATLDLNTDSTGLLTINVDNHGSFLTGIKVGIYNDVDKDGQFSASDTLITNSILQSINRGIQTVYADIISSINPELLCNLIVVIDQKDQCICNTTSFKIESDIKLIQDISICNGDSIIIGPQIVSQGGSYQWTDAVDISCTQCPNPTFNGSNPTLNPVTQTKTCIFTSIEGCSIRYDYNIMISANPTILGGNAQLCQGDTLYITATDAVSYQWSGPSILSGDGSTLVATPDQSSTYFVTITDQNGCTGAASTIVTVSESPSIVAEYDSIYCIGILPVIRLRTDSTNMVTWVNGFGRVDDIRSLSPKILKGEDFVYVVEVDNGLCITTVEVPIDFEQRLDLSGVLDSITTCPGEKLTVKLPEEFTYTFDSPVQVTCLNNPCFEITFIANNDITIQVTATDSNGCMDKQEMVIDVNTNVGLTEQTFNLCSGDTIQILGQQYFNEGTYCDTMVNSITGCHQVFCSIIKFRPPNILEDQFKICQGDSIIIDGIAFFDTGQYCRVLPGIGNQCDTSICSNISILPLPDTTSITTSYSVEEGSSFVLNAPPGFFNYIWSPSVGLSCNDCAQPIVTADTIREYTLTMIDINGCTNRTKIKINITTSCTSVGDKIPNAFTPNGDGQNDIYSLPDVMNCGPMRIVVFNRWGNIVYEDAEWDNMWDGRSKSSDRLPQGTYYIALTFEDLGITKTTMVDLRIE